MSFSQEVKDFVAGYQATSEVGQKAKALKLAEEKNKLDAENDKITQDLRRQQLAKSDAATASRLKLSFAASARADAAAARAERALAINEAASKNKGFETGLSGTATPDYGSLENAAAASDSEAGSANDWNENEGLAQFDYSGGLVQTAVEGALISAIPEDEPPIPMPRPASRMPPAPAQAAAPIPMPRPASRTTPAAAIPTSAPAKATMAQPDTGTKLASLAASNNTGTQLTLHTAGMAAEAGMKKLTQEFNATKAPPTEAIATTATAPATATTPATAEEITAIRDKIDPTKTLDPFMEGAKFLSEGYQYFMDRGQVDKAANYAAQIIAYNKEVSMSLGEQAQSALEKGDTGQAIQLITGAYNTIPDGQTIQTSPRQDGTIGFRIMQGNKVVQEGAVNTQQLWQMAGSVADGSAFIDHMARLADQYSPKKIRSKFDDAATSFAEINAEWHTLKAEYDKADGATQKKLKEKLDGLQQDRLNAYKQVHTLGSPLYKSRKDVDSALKSAIDTYGTEANANPRPELPPEFNKMVDGYRATEQNLTQLQAQLNGLDRNSQSYEADAAKIKQQMQPLVQQNANMREKIMAAAPGAFPDQTPGDLMKSVDAMLKENGGTATPVTSAIPTNGAKPGEWDSLVNQYQTYNSQLNQLNEKLAATDGDPNSQAYRDVYAQMVPLVTARDRIKGQIDRLAPSVLRGQNDAERRTAVDTALKSSNVDRVALPITPTDEPAPWANSWTTYPQDTLDRAKEAELLKRIDSGEKITFKPLNENDTKRAVDAILTRNLDPNVIVGKLLRDGYDPQGVVAMLARNGKGIEIDLSKIPLPEMR